VQVEHDRCCISGCYIKGTEVSSIPLETVVDVQTDAQNKGCLTKCAPYVSEIKIVTPGAVITQNRVSRAVHPLYPSRQIMRLLGMFPKM
jgi:hypothetical protein